MTRYTTRRTVLEAVGGATAVALAGCLDRVPDPAGSSTPTPEPEDAGEPGTPADEFTVEVTSDPFPEFKPQIVHVNPGATVEWLVESGRHDVTGYHRDVHPPHRAPEDAEPWESEALTGPGATFEYTFEREGVYDYVDTRQVCINHEVAGNVGRVIVGWPDPDDHPGMTPPSEDMERRVQRAIEEFNEETWPVLEDGPP